jgi:sugar O-acyltransferase (sialic acid O-acetyltransferase NeuD family)
MISPIVLIGGGGHCASSIEVIESTMRWKIAGIVDVIERYNENVLGYKIIGTDNDLPLLAKSYKMAIITIGQIKSAEMRMLLNCKAVNAGFKMATIIASTALVSRSAKLGEGTIIFHKAFVNSRAVVGANCIINTGAIIEHDASVNSYCHISTGAIVNGGCRIGEGCFIGSGATIKNNITINDNIIVGIGAVVIQDLYEAGIYVGNPAKRLR